VALTPAEKMRKQRITNPKLRINAIDLDPADTLQNKLHASWQSEPNKKWLFISLYSEHLQQQINKNRLIDDATKPLGLPQMQSIVEGLSRDADAAQCNKCYGYAEKQDEAPTIDEIKLYDCGRSYACCTAVFKCRVCGNRIIGRLIAPDYC
jgi:NAD-dependent SIR2 family protein deacetylase